LGDLIFVLIIIYIFFRAYLRARKRKEAYERRHTREQAAAGSGAKPKTIVHPLPEKEICRTPSTAPDVPEAGKIYESTSSVPGGDSYFEKTALKQQAVSPAGKGRLIDLRDNREQVRGIIYSEVLGPPRSLKPWSPPVKNRYGIR